MAYQEDLLCSGQEGIDLQDSRLPHLHVVNDLVESVTVEVANSSIPNTNGFLSVGKLLEVKKFALRRRVWFSSLSRIERGVIDLTLHCVDDIKSLKLVKVLTTIIQKLQQATESKADWLVRTFGFPLAQKMSHIAVSLGNRLAPAWAQDVCFARYLAFCVAKT